MYRLSILFSLLTLVVTSSLATAQPPAPLPDIVQQQINDETILVLRINLTGPSLATISKFLGELPDPSGAFGMRAANCDLALQKLDALKVTEVFAVVSSTQLPVSGATILVPSRANEIERTKIADALRSLWPDDVEIRSDGVLVADSASRHIARKLKPSLRPELSSAFTAVKEAQVQIAIGLASDTRRALQAAMPTIPSELGSGSIGPIIGSWQWLAVGITPTPKLALQVVIQATDASAAKELERIAGSVLNSAAENKDVKAVLPNVRGVISLLTPLRTDARLVVSLNEANGGAKRLMDEIATPALTRMQADAQRMKTINNIKQIMLAMHNYHDKHGAFPPQAARSADGKVLLSWRVLILPFLDEVALYKEFHLDEPWDSEHNRKLVTRMPEVYASSNISRQQRTDGMTTYVGPIADKTLFASREGMPLQKITDGTSNTLAFVDANRNVAVPWSKPTDLEIDLSQPLKDLTGQIGGMFRAAICDGSVRGITETINIETFRRLIQINDGEVVGDF